jgi:hypothetical protein
MLYLRAAMQAIWLPSRKARFRRLLFGQMSSSLRLEMMAGAELGVWGDFWRRTDFGRPAGSIFPPGIFFLALEREGRA